VAEPRAKKYSPESVVDSQFSMPFGAAVAAIDGAAGLDQFALEKTRSPKIRELMNKVVLVKDTRIEETFPKEWPAHVVIELENGQRHEKLVRYPKGDPENPLTWDEMTAKFRSLAGAVLSTERCDEIIEATSAAKPATLPALTAPDR
jgi:2-methylcitrate dehydratase PrpD